MYKRQVINALWFDFPAQLSDTCGISTVILAIFFYIQINSLSSFGSEHMATCSDDGTLRLWTVASREQALQFQVLDQVDLNSLFKDKLNLKHRSPIFILLFAEYVLLYRNALVWLLLPVSFRLLMI